MISFEGQFKIINEIFPCKFTRDELTIEKSIKTKNYYKRFDELKTSELLEIYYEIHTNHRKAFTTKTNNELCIIYDSLKDYLISKKIDYAKYTQGREKKLLYSNFIVIGVSIIYYFIFNITLTGSMLSFYPALILFIFRKKIGKLLRKLKLGNEYISLLYLFLKYIIFASILGLALNVKKYNSVLFLSISYMFLIILQIYYILKVKKYIRKFTNIKLKKAFTYIIYIFLITIAVLSYNPISDTIDYILGVESSIEGVCVEITPLDKKYSQVTINNTNIIVDNKTRKFKVGTMYKINYGYNTKAIISIKKVNLDFSKTYHTY